jgi:hypothetical protein
MQHYNTLALFAGSGSEILSCLSNQLRLRLDMSFAAYRESRRVNTSQKSEWKPLAYLFGAIIGVLVGLLSAHLYTRAVEERTDGERPHIQTGDIFALGMTMLSLVRHVTDLGARPPQR